MKKVVVLLSFVLLMVVWFTPAQSAVEYLLKNQADSSTAANSLAVLHITNLGTSPQDRGAGIKAFNRGTGSGPGYSFGIFGGTKASGNSAGFNGWASNTNAGNAMGVKGSAEGDGMVGVYGESRALSGAYTNGIYGTTRSYQATGVVGHNSGGSTLSGYGVRGTSNSYGGMLGVGSQVGVYGDAYVPTGGYGFYTGDAIFTSRGCVGCNNVAVVAQNQSGKSWPIGQLLVLGQVYQLDNSDEMPIFQALELTPNFQQPFFGVVQTKIEIYETSLPNPSCEWLHYQAMPQPTPGASIIQHQESVTHWENEKKSCEQQAEYAQTQVITVQGQVEPNNYLVASISGLAYIKLPANLPAQANGWLVYEANQLVITSETSDKSFVVGRIVGPTDLETGLTPIYLGQ